MGLFGGKSEDDLRGFGTLTTARVTQSDDTGKRRDGGAFARVKVRLEIDSGSARGRELKKTKWVPVDRLPRVGDQVHIHFDPDDVDDWAWADRAMYGPPAPRHAAAPDPQTADPFAGVDELGVELDVRQIRQMIGTAFAQRNVPFTRADGTIDVMGDPQLREQIMGQLRAHGVDLEALQAQANAARAGAPPPAADDTAVRLRQLDELHRQGILSDEEHREQRQRIIDSI